MTEIPPPGSRGPRRHLNVTEDELARMIAEAKATADRLAHLDQQAADCRLGLARRCAAMQDVGLSISGIAKALGITRASAQRLVDSGHRHT